MFISFHYIYNGSETSGKKKKENRKNLSINGSEIISISGIDKIQPNKLLKCKINRENSIKEIYELGEFQVDGNTIVLSEQMDWPVSRNIYEEEICKDTFEKATRYCSNKMKEIFLKENRPRTQCPQHVSPFSRFQDK